MHGLEREASIVVRPPGKDPSKVSARWLVPDDPVAAYVFAHGAGAGMDHAFMASLATRLCEHGIATLRYNFPYMEAGSRRPSPRPTLLATVAAAVAWAHEHGDALPVFAGGKSMGGRMTSELAAQDQGLAVRGIIFMGFPLHPAGKPSTARADHLARVSLPMVFLHGTRDRLGSLADLRPVVDALGPRATLHVVEGGDHGFAVRKMDKRPQDGVYDELAATAAAWIRARLSGD